MANPKDSLPCTAIIQTMQFTKEVEANSKKSKHARLEKTPLEKVARKKARASSTRKTSKGTPTTITTPTP